jgi:alpha-L-fucosidase
MKKVGVIIGATIASIAIFVIAGCHFSIPVPAAPYTVSSVNQDSLHYLDSVQNSYLTMKFGMFIHFNMSTFARCCDTADYSVSGEWEQGHENENLYHPWKLDCGQWADVAKSAGCKYAILTSKHHGGFCNWPTAYGTHSVGYATDWIAASPNGPRNVVKEFVDSMRSRGLEVGLYYSIWDRTNGSSLSLIEGQLGELLDTTKYGKLRCIWFDGWGWQVGYSQVPYDSIRNFVKSKQPGCLLIENNHRYALSNTEIVQYEVPVDGYPQLGNTAPTEANIPIIDRAGLGQRCWFWHPPVVSCQIMSASNIQSDVTTVNSRHSNYLLDVTPDTNGIIPDCQVSAMAQAGTLLGVK